MATLREKLSAPDAFVIGTELVTSRGVLEQHSGQALVELAHQLAENPRIDFLSLTDNPGGNPMIAPDMLAALRAGKQLKVSFQDMAKETIAIPIPLADFAAAYDKIK